MRRSGIPEFVEQCHLVRWLALCFPGCLFTASCAGMRTSLGVGKKMKASGAKAGVPDLMIFEQKGGYGGLFVEMKRVDGGNVSQEQRQWLEYLNRRGYKAVICKGYDEAVEVISNYLTQPSYGTDSGKVYGSGKYAVAGHGASDNILKQYK